MNVGKIILGIIATFIILLLVLQFEGRERVSGGSPTAPPLIPKSDDAEMVLIPAGEFMMGQADASADAFPHKVSLASFYMDRVEVTQGMYAQIMGVNPSKRKNKDAPVEGIQWVDAALFCNKCSEVRGLKPCYDTKTWTCDFDADGYRLPTEAEWEYACRASDASGAQDSLAQVGWFKENSTAQAHSVGGKKPNSWGLFDMRGNVWEWCNDFYDAKAYALESAENPKGPKAGKQRVLRGGAYDSSAEKCTSHFRNKEFPAFADACFGQDNYGIRRVRNVSGRAKPATEPAHAAALPSQPRALPQEDVKPPEAPAEKARASITGSIVFVSDRTGVLNIWIMDAQGKSQRALTSSTSPNADPRFSPNGKLILFTRQNNGIPEVWQMNRDGSDQHSITQGCQGSWSPKGDAIVFIRENQLYVRELQKGTERRISPEGWSRCGVPAWSPDGTCIALASRHTESIGIYMVPLAGGEPVHLATKEDACTPCWSKDGKHLLCQTVKGHVHQLDADGKNWEQVTYGADLQHFASYSPDESHILFCRAPAQDGPWQICIMPVNGDGFTQLTCDGSNLQPDWTGVE